MTHSGLQVSFQIGRCLTTQQFKCRSQHRRLNTCSPNLPTVERQHGPPFDYFKPLRSQEQNKNSKTEGRRKRNRLFYETTRRPHCDRLIHACHRNLGMCTFYKNKIPIQALLLHGAQRFAIQWKCLL